MNLRVPHSRPFVGAAEIAAVRRVIASGHLAQGEYVAALEHELPERVGHRHGIAVSSGTAALFLALKGLGVGPGDRVVIPSYVCTALLNAVIMAGAQPLLADVDPQTGNATAQTVRRAVRARTRAIIVPHLFGYPADVEEIAALGIPVIEDCAQCVGASIDGRRVGALTAVSVFSFYATKLLAAGEGGLVATSDTRLAGILRDLRDYDKRPVYRPRFNFKLSDVHAALALSQVRKLDAITALRRGKATEYRRRLADVAGIRLPPDDPRVDPIYYRFVVRVGSPGVFVRALSHAGIECGRPVYKPLHRYIGRKGFPGTDALHRTALSLPLYPGLSREQVRHVCANTIRAAGKGVTT